MDEKIWAMVALGLGLIVSEIMAFLPTQYKGIVQAGLGGGKSVCMMLYPEIDGENVLPN